jgi:hypothetical protein
LVHNPKIHTIPSTFYQRNNKTIIMKDCVPQFIVVPMGTPVATGEHKSNIKKSKKKGSISNNNKSKNVYNSFNDCFVSPLRDTTPITPRRFSYTSIDSDIEDSSRNSDDEHDSIESEMSWNLPLTTKEVTDAAETLRLLKEEQEQEEEEQEQKLEQDRDQHNNNTDTDLQIKEIHSMLSSLVLQEKSNRDDNRGPSRSRNPSKSNRSSSTNMLRNSSSNRTRSSRSKIPGNSSSNRTRSSSSSNIKIPRNSSSNRTRSHNSKRSDQRARDRLSRLESENSRHAIRAKLPSTVSPTSIITSHRRGGPDVSQRQKHGIVFSPGMQFTHCRHRGGNVSTMGGGGSSSNSCHSSLQPTDDVDGWRDRSFVYHYRTPQESLKPVPPPPLWHNILPPPLSQAQSQPALLQQQRQCQRHNNSQIEVPLKDHQPLKQQPTKPSQLHHQSAMKPKQAQHPIVTQHSRTRRCRNSDIGPFSASALASKSPEMQRYLSSLGQRPRSLRLS